MFDRQVLPFPQGSFHDLTLLTTLPVEASAPAFSGAVDFALFDSVVPVSESHAQPGSVETPQIASGLGPFWATIAVLGALWLILIDQLRLNWSTNPQYSYGWLVPFLAAYLFWQRWLTRPAATRPAFLAFAGLAAALLALAFFPTRLVREASPEWSTVSWALALEVVGLTLAALVYMGGWRTMRHFAWPIGFFLVAVAWPLRFETALTQSLMRHLAGITAEIVSWAGVSAMQDGNLIRLPTGVVGVDEACSGVRSLQSMFMAALFLGELHRLAWLSRLALLVVGLGLALFFNILRALLLVSVAAHSGLPELSKWHDPAGFSILVLSFIVLCFAVRFFPKPAGFHSPSHAPDWRPLPTTLIILLGSWLVLTEIATEAWYRSHETGTAQKLAWKIRWPESAPQFQDIPVNANVRSLLAYSEGREAAWREPDGSRWLTFFFKWYPARTSTISARQHRPEVCLPANGRTMRAELAPQIVPVGELQIPFRTYIFEDNGRPLYVFFCLWEVANRDTRQAGWRQDYTTASRLQRVWMGQRNLGQQSLEVILSGPDSPEEAAALFRRQMAALLVAQPS